MADLFNELVLRMLDAAIVHHGWFVAVVLTALFACVVLFVRALRGRPVPGKYLCRVCRYPCPQQFDPRTRGATVICAECGAPISTPRDTVPVTMPPRIGPTVVWAGAAVLLLGIVNGAHPGRLTQWQCSWASSMHGATILAGLSRGDMATVRATAALLDSSEPAPFTPNEFLMAVAKSPQFTDPDVPARRVWEYAAAVARGWGSIRDGAYAMAHNTGAPGAPELPYTALPDPCPWPQLAVGGGSGTGMLRSRPFAPSRTLEDSRATRGLGALVEREPWELAVDEDGETTLRWLAPGDCLVDLPLTVAGSYRVVIRRGEVSVAGGALFVCQVGPDEFRKGAGTSDCVIQHVTGLTRDIVGDGAPLVIDLHPDPNAALSMPGFGPLARRDFPHLRCDPHARLGIPLHVRVNGVPGRLIGVAR